MKAANGSGGRERLLYFEISQGKILKALSNIIKANFPKATFIVTETGIFLQENNGGKTENDPVTTILEIVLHREKFDVYQIPKIEGDGQLCLGFTSLDLKTALERVTKTDAVRMYILQDNPSILFFDIVSVGNNTSTKFITLVQPEIGHVFPPEYEEHLPVAVAKMDQFKKSTTDANKNSKTKIRVSVQRQGVMFESVGSSMRGIKDTFGNWVDGSPIFFSEELSTARIHSFSGMAATGVKQIQIYSEEGKPIKFRADAGPLGSVSLYLQPGL